MERHRPTDAQWERIAALVPGKPGDPGRHGENIACSSKPCFGSAAPARPGAICRRNLAAGIRSMAAKDGAAAVRAWPPTRGRMRRR